jgi:hypothetical protein
MLALGYGLALPIKASEQEIGTMATPTQYAIRWTLNGDVLPRDYQSGNTYQSMTHAHMTAERIRSMAINASVDYLHQAALAAMSYDVVPVSVAL